MAKQQVTGTVPITRIKRCYLDGAVVKAECRKCGAMMSNDLGCNYLSYPDPGNPDESIYLSCDECDAGYELPIAVSNAVITVAFDLDKMVEEL